MNTNSLMTVGAIGFAGFALWYITRKPGGAVTMQPAQRAKDSALTLWNDLQVKQSDEILGLNFVSPTPTVGFGSGSYNFGL
ncbi:MAG TPA: hypothetical protein VNU71_14605 [Burkholderiaceae bacterium]|nr:hypothetical protein [Burkholderiaceae bacterium]